MKLLFKILRFVLVAKNLLTLTLLSSILFIVTGCCSEKPIRFPNFHMPNSSNCFFRSISRDNKLVAIECITGEGSEGGHTRRNLLVSDSSETEWFPLFSTSDSPVKPLYADFSPDTTMLAVTDMDGVIWIYKTSNWKVIRIFHYPWIRGRLSWSPDSKSMAVEGRGDIALTLLMMNGNYRKLLSHSDIFPEKKKIDHYDLDTWQITWSPNGKKIAYLVYETTQDKITENQLWTIEIIPAKKEMLAKSSVSNSNTNLILANISWSPDGKMIAAKGQSLIQLYNTRDKKLETIFKVKGSPYNNYIPLASRILWSSNSSQIAFHVFNGALNVDDTYFDKEGIYVLTLPDLKLKIRAETQIDLLKWTSDNNFIVVDYKDINQVLITTLSPIDE